MSENGAFADLAVAVESRARVIDISMPIDELTASWDDRFPVVPSWHSRIDHGGRTTNSSWMLHSHTGTHVDAPLHHLGDGGNAGSLDLADMLGPCRVLDVSTAPGQIGAAQLRGAHIAAGSRILFRTQNSVQRLSSREHFERDYIGLTEEAADYLVELGVRLVGVDYLSVEPYDAPGFATHCTLLGSGIIVLEGLVLDTVEEGDYLLCFLPIALRHSEAAPGRAVLIRPSSEADR